jgi:hypothetical protein
MTAYYVDSQASGGGDGSSGAPWTLAEAASGVSAGDVVNVHAGTYQRTSTLSLPDHGADPTSPIIFRGYSDTPGDATAPVATITSAVGMTSRLQVSGDFYRLENIEIAGAVCTFGVVVTGDGVLFKRCGVGTGNTGIAVSGNSAVLLGCEVTGWGDSAEPALAISGLGAMVLASYIHDGVGQGITVLANGGMAAIVDTVVANTGWCAINGSNTYAGLPSWGLVDRCTVVAAGSCGIDIDGAYMPWLIRNSIFTGCPTAAVNADLSCKLIVAGMAAYGNGSILGSPQNIEVVTPIIELDSLPFVDAANGDYRLKALSPTQRAALAGWPDRFLVDGALSWQNYPELGAAVAPPRVSSGARGGGDGIGL